MVSGRQAPTVSSASPSIAIGRRLFLVLAQRRIQYGAALEHQTLGRADHAVDDGALQQLPASADHHPSESGKPAAGMQRLEEALDVGAVLHRNVDVHPVGTGQPRSGVRPKEACTRRAPHDPGGGLQRWQHRGQCRPVAAMLHHCGGDVAGHALGVEIQQRQRGLSFTVDDVGAGARDSVRRAVQFLLGDDLYRIREAVSKGAKGNGFVRL